ncbi:hypothetical protein BLNAU_10129 [Blattamonas nauphoetae]|uniref:Transposase n=1 Tax=Blattamonas nauphoetae TaxID=2049346 RepID=A0ABQ9XU44_9EUKA|nr:hypothetical protein BLNAU_10129 [Blattamonas nauphoetae]
MEYTARHDDLIRLSANPIEKRSQIARIRPFLPTLPESKQNRFDFAKETLSKGYLPDLCLFDDEKTVRGRGPDKYYRSLSEKDTQRPESESRAHPIKLNIWGCVGVGFKSNLFITEENINGRIYTDALINGLTNAQMDPPLGDLNPIEHVWAMLTTKLYENFETFLDLSLDLPHFQEPTVDELLGILVGDADRWCGGTFGRNDVEILFRKALSERSCSTLERATDVISLYLNKALICS